MLHGETIAALADVERRFDVAAWTIDGLHVWPIVRTWLTFQMLLDGRGRAPQVGRVQRAMTAARTVRDYARDAPALVRRPSRADVLFLSRPTSRQRLGDTFFDRYFDPIGDIVESLGMRSLHLEYRAPGTRYRTPRRRPSLLIEPALVRALSSAAIAAIGTHDVRLVDYAQADRHLRAQYPGMKLPPLPWLRLRTHAVHALAAYFEEMLRTVQPRLAMCSCYYSLVGMAFCLAANRRGVRSVDVQHGVTLRNPAYDGWLRFPKGGYALLPRDFWCWTEQDAQPVDQWPDTARPHHSTLVGGHPWMALWRADARRAADFTPRIEAIRGDGLNILASLTCTSGLSPLLQQVLRGAPRGWRWWIRLHPRMHSERNQIRALCKVAAPGRVYVDTPSDLPLPLVLKHADVHLTHNSTVIQEATALRVPSVLIDRHGLDVYSDDLRTGWAVFAERPQTILDALQKQSQDAPRPTPPRHYPSWAGMQRALKSLLDLQQDAGADHAAVLRATSVG